MEITVTRKNVSLDKMKKEKISKMTVELDILHIDHYLKGEKDIIWKTLISIFFLAKCYP
jgi:hypothetical protein